MAAHPRVAQQHPVLGCARAHRLPRPRRCPRSGASQAPFRHHPTTVLASPCPSWSAPGPPPLQEMQDQLASSEEERNALKRQLAKLTKKYQQVGAGPESPGLE